MKFLEMASGLKRFLYGPSIAQKFYVGSYYYFIENHKFGLCINILLKFSIQFFHHIVGECRMGNKKIPTHTQDHGDA